MVQIIPSPQRKESFGSVIGKNVAQGLQSGTNFAAKLYENRLQNEAKEKLFAQEIAQKERLLEKEYGLRGTLEQLKQQAKYEEKMKMLQNLGFSELGGMETENNLGLLDQEEKSPFLLGITSPKQQQKLSKKQPTSSKKSSDDGLIPTSEILKASLVDPNIARSMEAHNKTIQKKKEQSPEYQRQQYLTQEQAKADTKFYSDLQERRSKQILKKESLSRLENMTKKGATGKPYEKYLESIGLTALTSEGRREYSAEAKNQFTDFKSIVGSQMSAQEFFTLAGAYPSADFSKEANEAIINNLKQVHDTLDKEYEIATNLKKQNGGKIPEQFQEKINEKLQEYVSSKVQKMKENIRIIQNEQYGIPKGHTLMFDHNGDPLSVPEDKVIELIEEGLANLP